MTTVTQLINPVDRANYKRLLESLGSENNPSQWLTFMETMLQVLPEILSSGRPSKTVIENCLIGRLGFSSWKEMLETPVNKNGLGWSVSGWNSFKRAWNTVEKYPYLKTKNLKSGWINKYVHQWKDEFPETSEAFDEKVANSKEIEKEKRKQKVEQELDLLRQQVTDNAQTIADLRTKIQNLNQQVSAASATVKTLTTAKDDAESQLAEANRKIGSLESDHKTEINNIKSTKNKEIEKLKSDLRAIENRSTWEKIKALFG